MPKLDPLHIRDRLHKRLQELEAGEEIAAKDIRALLTDEQQAALDAAWAEQQKLRKNGRARTEEEQRALGWKSKREVRIEAFKQACAEADKGILAALQKMQSDAEVRQARIYFDTLCKALDEGRDNEQAKTMANNALTRAGLRRMDGLLRSPMLKRKNEASDLGDQLHDEINGYISQDELKELEKLKPSKGSKKSQGTSNE